VISWQLFRIIASRAYSSAIDPPMEIAHYRKIMVDASGRVETGEREESLNL
jgi:hypothetical protein